MKRKNNYYKSIVFMKAGAHSGYDLGEIFEMKKREEHSCGRFYWGYSGTLCHPSRVHRFVSQLNSRGHSSSDPAPMLVLAYTASAYSSNIGKLTEYSVDGRVWFPLHPEVSLTGCQYAVVGRHLRPVDITIDLNKYKTVSGEKIGKPLGEYIRYRVNKACAIFHPDGALPQRNVRVLYVGELISPYCVCVRANK